MGSGQALLSMLSSGLSQDCEIVGAVISDKNGDGAIANQFDDLIEYIDEYSAIDQVQGRRGESLEKIVKYFIGLKKYYEETDENILRRFLAITTRGGDTVWGTTWNIKHLFEQYFPTATVFVCENTGEEDANLLTNHDFEITDGSWTYINCTRSIEAAFSDYVGILFNAVGSCEQLVPGLNGTYSLHAFITGKINIIIKNDTDGKFWNTTSRSWKTSEVKNTFTTTEWQDVQAFIQVPGPADITIKFEGISGETTFLDYVRLTEKTQQSEFSVIIHYSGENSGKVLSLSPGEGDPTAGIGYDKASYYDNVYMQGKTAGTAIDIYEDILAIVKPSGIKANLEFLMLIVE